MPTAIHLDPSPPDSGLILRFQAGNTGVFDQLYLRHRDRIHAVTPCQRTVFALRYNDDLSLKCIARRLNRSTGTVKAHLFHAHRTLHRELLPYFQFAV